MMLYIDIKVIPSSGTQKWALDKSGKLKCYLKSAPEGGKANNELIKLVASALKISSNKILIHLGTTCRNKVLKIETDMTREQFLLSLGLEIQQTFL